MELASYQQPHPPVWYGVHAPESAVRAARRGLQVVSLDPVNATRAAFAAFRAAWRAAWGGKPLPLMGLGRFVVVAHTDAAALAIARRAYPRWHDSFTFLHRKHGRLNAHPRPATFEGLAEVGQGVAGAPATVASFLRRELNETGSNYCVCQFAFGDLSDAEIHRSVELFARDIMPELAGLAALAAD
jgi:alkanesulfonate monooxygenase SsuD/methylene tetrahydromethanopterin reductase-like flavin-dependent oxidoreductase (luciferase family)